MNSDSGLLYCLLVFLIGLWGEALDQQQRYKDLCSCYEQALEVFPDSEEVHNSLGTHLYRLG